MISRLVNRKRPESIAVGAWGRGLNAYPWGNPENLRGIPPILRGDKLRLHRLVRHLTLPFVLQLQESRALQTVQPLSTAA
ncbi:MAG: hypothetical protein H6Q00_1335 [Holophagaceae bacterium]|nr:hypothetical protein [Holophagaceae bacterium]